MNNYSNETAEQKQNRVKLIQRRLSLPETGEWNKDTEKKFSQLMKEKNVSAFKLSENTKLNYLKSKLKPSSSKVEWKPEYNTLPKVEVKKESVLAEPEEESSFMDSINNLVDLGSNYIDRTIKKYTDDEGDIIEKKPSKDTASVKTSEKKTVQLKEPPIKALSDTIVDSKRHYRVPVSIDLDETSNYKTRNRGSRNDINTDNGGLISTFFPFQDKSKVKRTLGTDSEFIGVNKKTGKIKVGALEDFDDEYQLSETYHPDKISDIDLSGNNYDSNLKRPVVKGIRSNGQLSNLPIGLGKDKNPNKLSDLSGGKILITTPDKSQQQFIYGTATQLKEELANFKKKYKTNEVLLYHLDNGTYNQTLQTYDKKLTKDDLSKWDSKNTSGGHFIYHKEGGIISKLDTVYYKGK